MNNGVRFKNNKKASEALNVYFSNKLRFEQNLYYCRPGPRADNQGNQNEGSWLKNFHRLIMARKPTGFTSLQVNCREINQVKHQKESFKNGFFSKKLAKEGLKRRK